MAGLVAVVVVAVAVGTWAATRSSAGAPTTRLVNVTTRTLRSTVAATGTIQPAQTANLSFGVSGQVTSVTAAVGEAVKAGQPLATINAASLSTSVAEANATVANDAAKLTSDTNAGATSAQLAADQAALSSAQAAYTVAQDRVVLSDADRTDRRQGGGGQPDGRPAGQWRRNDRVRLGRRVRLVGRRIGFDRRRFSRFGRWLDWWRFRRKRICGLELGGGELRVRLDGVLGVLVGYLVIGAGGCHQQWPLPGR